MKQKLTNCLGQIFKVISKQTRFVCLFLILCPTVSYATSTEMPGMIGGFEGEGISPFSMTDNFDQVFYAYNADSQPATFYQRLVNDSYPDLKSTPAAADVADNMIAMNTSLTNSDVNIFASAQVPQTNSLSNRSPKDSPGLATLSVPASMWLFGAALIGFVTISRRVSF